MDKETKSSKSRSCRYHDEKIRGTRSVDRNHPHSPKHSFRKVCSSSSLSPIIKNKGMTELDELQGEMNKIKLFTFYGEHKKDEDFETWLLGMRKYFNYIITLHVKKGELPSMSSRETDQCGGDSLCKYNTLMRKSLFGESSTGIFKRNT